MSDVQACKTIEKKYYGDPEKCIAIMKHSITPGNRLMITVGLFGLRAGWLDIVKEDMIIKLTTDKPSRHARQILAKFNIHTDYSFVLMTANERPIVFLRDNAASFDNNLAIPMDMAIDIAERVLDFCDWKVEMTIIQPPKRQDIPPFQQNSPADPPAKRQKVAPAPKRLVIRSPKPTTE